MKREFHFIKLEIFKTSCKITNKWKRKKEETTKRVLVTLLKGIKLFYPKFKAIKLKRWRWLNKNSSRKLTNVPLHPISTPNLWKYSLAGSLNTSYKNSCKMINNIKPLPIQNQKSFQFQLKIRKCIRFALPSEVSKVWINSQAERMELND